MMTGKVSEIFSSIQGEGIYAGTPMVFVRFAGCNLQCDYCDTPESRSVVDKKIKILTVKEIAGKIDEEIKKVKNISIISFTGGEPLLQDEIISDVISLFKNKNIKMYLDTNGVLHEKFSKLARTMDYVAMDIKLPSACGKEYWKEHKEFLKTTHKNIFIKIVLTAKSNYEEFKKAVDLIEGIDKSIPLVLQPVTPIGNVKSMPFDMIRALKKLAEEKLENVSIIPQMHKKLGIK
ncbi:MAG: 7-carboxy-7-deazaguanine synthase QueE [Elusimicrobia bacterium]|nr:7-carboxy-7-deazaguanine synthase QueE [Elusimicrobiota bacterium]